MRTRLFLLGSLPSSTLYRYVPAYVDGSNFQVLQLNLSNRDTIGTKIFVLINEVSLFQEEKNTYLYKVGTRSSILFLFQGCPYGRFHYIIKTFILCNVPAHRDFKFVCKLSIVTTLSITIELFLAGYVYLHVSCSQE